MTISLTQVNYQWTNQCSKAKEWLEDLALKPLFAADFETAVLYSPEAKEELKQIADNPDTPYLIKKDALARLSATGLDFPEHLEITHLSVAWSSKDAYVFVLDSPEITELVLHFLVTTEVKQIWHRASYDFKLLYYFTGKMPKNYEDTQLYAKTLFNHVEVHKATTGLKELAGAIYGDWAVDSDSFTKEEMYTPKMLRYAATDACATFWVYERIRSQVNDKDFIYPDTTEDYSPWEQLPAPTPIKAEYADSHFYHNTMKWLIRDTVRIMVNGLPISLPQVMELEKELVTIIQDVEQRLQQNPYIHQYLEQKQSELVKEYIKIQESRLKTASDFYAPFDYRNILHRSMFMKLYCEATKIKPPITLVEEGIPKWSVTLLKKFAALYPPLKNLLTGNIEPIKLRAEAAANAVAQHKADIHNKKYLNRIANPQLPSILFNPGSAKQKSELFRSLGLESGEQSKITGEDSWGREQIEQTQKETNDQTLKDLIQALVDYSYAAIVQNNFVQAFYRYTVNGRLHGTYNLFGAKSGRYTSQNPNMLNTPSSGSIFAKPVKKCFIAPPGFIVGAIDYAALEDRVIANLSKDINKLNVFLKGLDGHSLAALYYWPQASIEVLGDISNINQAALRFKAEVDNGNVTLKKLRSEGKGISFGLAYGAFPPKIAKSAKLPLAEALAIFNAYHYEMYPGITKYREEYVLKTSQEQGYIHLGLGARMYTDNPVNDIRTLNNGTCQFWSILTALTINRLHQLIDKENLSNDIFVTSTIYDSIYFCIRDNPETIKWLNDRIITIMEKDFMEDQIVPNSVDLEIGPSWAELFKLFHNASIEEIIEVRNKWT